MADTNETQLLSDLLVEIAREDAQLDASHLEMRVIEASVAARSMQQASGAHRLRYVTIAAVVFVVLIPALFFIKRAPAVDTIHTETAATEGDIARSEKPVVVQPSVAAQPVPPAIVPGPVAEARRTRRAAPAKTTMPAPSSSLDEFVPLMPMTEHELAGPFQLVRVQMPRASLGPLRSPLDRPNEIVEADVLLGEDGMARAIRVSTSESVYPRRFR